MFSYVRITDSSTLPDLGMTDPFVSIVVIENTVMPERQREISMWLVRSGCLYMLAWGENCASWDDSVDLACLEYHGFGEIPPGESVVTTWHENCRLEEVMTFAKSFVSHPDVTLKDIVIVHLGSTDKGEQYDSMYSGAEVVKI